MGGEALAQVIEGGLEKAELVPREAEVEADAAEEEDVEVVDGGVHDGLREEGYGGGGIARGDRLRVEEGRA